MRPQLREAVRAAQDHKAVDLNVLNLTGSCSFTDYFLICSGTSRRHAQAVCDAISEKLLALGVTPAHVEGYSQAEWILVDYMDFVVHIFSRRAREYYDLERLWKKAEKIQIMNDE